MKVKTSKSRISPSSIFSGIVGAGGVLVPPDGYIEGIRGLCDKRLDAEVWNVDGDKRWWYFSGLKWGWNALETMKCLTPTFLVGMNLLLFRSLKAGFHMGFIYRFFRDIWGKNSSTSWYFEYYRLYCSLNFLGQIQSKPPKSLKLVGWESSPIMASFLEVHPGSLT